MRHDLFHVDGRLPLRCLVPQTPQECRRGLEILDRISDLEGMLFDYPVPRICSIHMAGVIFPLDLLFVLGGRVVAIDPDCQPGDPRIWQAYADQVLEVRGGWCRDFQVGIGASLTPGVF